MANAPQCLDDIGPVGQCSAAKHRAFLLRRLKNHKPRSKYADLTFATKSKAEEHAFKMCRSWIDEQSVKP
jgi:hypothetical protein